MSALTPTVAHRAARNAASIALADDGAGTASIRLYTASGGTLLATRALQKPCGAVVPGTGRIALAQSASDDLVTTSGTATHGEWVAADGTVIATGAVSDAAGAGPFKLTTGTSLIAGGLLLLAEPALLG